MAYKFNCSYLDTYRNEIINRKLENVNEENGFAAWGVAVLEMEWIDIELNLSAVYSEADETYTSEPDLSYFICLRGLDNFNCPDWISAGYIDHLFPVTVDFAADDWKEKLEKEMYDVLQKVIEKYGFKTNEPNFHGDYEAIALLGIF